MMQGLPPDALPLRDLKLPAEPGFWPLAPGWWVLLLVVVTVLAWLLLLALRYREKKRRWQQIEQQLADIQFRYSQSQDRQHLLTELSVFLRRFVRFQLQQTEATSLAGEAWVSHLNRLQPGAFDDFEQALTTGVYAPACDYDAEQLLRTTQQFIKRHVMRPKLSQAVGASDV